MSSEASRRRPPRVVIDTNLLVSALVFQGGAVSRLRQAWQCGACLPLASAATIRELVRVLAYSKFKLSAAEQQELLADYLPYVKSVRVVRPLDPPPACRDPGDVMFFELAVAGRAEVLLSGDQDVLALTGRFVVPILKVDAFLAGLAPPQDDE